jgi:hypothetical protein
LADAVGASIFKEEVAEGDMCNSLASSLCHNLTHDRLIGLVGAWRGQSNRPQRQLGRSRLRCDQLAPHRMHCHAICYSVERRQQTRHIEICSLPKKMQSPSAVLA